MIKVEFTAAPIFARLDRAARALDDLTPLHQEIGEYMVEATRQRFIRGEAPDGSPWAPKKTETIARYQERGDGYRPKPLIGPSGRLGREIAMFANGEMVELGSALEYSAVMQDGAAKGAFGTDRGGRPIPWGAIPSRVWLGISEADEGNILDMTDEHIGAPFEE